MAGSWLGTYAYRKRIYVDSTNIDENLTYFPLPILLGTSVGQSSQDVSDIFDEVGASYLKIAVTGADKTVQLYCEVESWDNGTETAVLHVSGSALVIGASRDTEMYLYYDSAQDDNTTYVGLAGSVVAQSVWDSNFKAVYHMSEDPSGGAGAILDSTSNNNDGTSAGTMTTDDLVAGGLGSALDFDGNDDLIDCQSDASLDDLTTMSLEVFLNIGSQGGEYLNKTNWALSRDAVELYNTFSLNFDDTNAQWSFPLIDNGSYKHLAVTFNNALDATGFYLTDPCANLTGPDYATCIEAQDWYWYYNDGEPCDTSTLGPDCDDFYAWWYANQTPWTYAGYTPGGLSELESKEFYFWVQERVRQDPLVYFDGVSQTVTVVSNPVGTYSSDAAHGLIIANNVAQNSGLNADVSEVRISSSIRSAAWLKATTYGLNDDLITFEDSVEIEDIVPTDEPCELDCTNPYDNPVVAVDPYGDCGDVCAVGDPEGVLGLLYSTGRNTNHILLREASTNQTSFGLIDDAFSFTDVSLGNANGLFIKESGAFCVVGGNVTGHLGTGDKVAVTVLTDILAACSKVACSATGSSYVIKTDGSLWSCGANTYGELGLGDTTERLTFTQVDVGPFASVSAGYYCCFAIKEDGTLWATGNNNSGNLGFGDTTQRTSFEQESGGATNWAKISQSANNAFALAITEDGALYSCGIGTYGKTCLDATTNYTVFTARGDGDVWADAKAGANHSIALKTDGSLWTVGNGFYGQTGRGDYNTYTTMAQIGSDLYSAIGAGDSFSLALKNDGTVWATGANVYGQLGVNTVTAKFNTFQACVGLPGTVELTTKIACGSHHAFALDGESTYEGFDETDPYCTDDCPEFNEANPYDNNCA